MSFAFNFAKAAVGSVNGYLDHYNPLNKLLKSEPVKVLQKDGIVAAVCASALSLAFRFDFTGLLDPGVATRDAVPPDGSTNSDAAEAEEGDATETDSAFSSASSDWTGKSLLKSISAQTFEYVKTFASKLIETPLFVLFVAMLGFMGFVFVTSFTIIIGVIALFAFIMTVVFFSMAFLSTMGFFCLFVAITEFRKKGGQASETRELLSFTESLLRQTGAAYKMSHNAPFSTPSTPFSTPSSTPFKRKLDFEA
ncbi:uncharacterized protein LOC106174587 isoform X2 [Lingula anatina]|nr:uncharacterized protein LOC106174587 isoform X2 [Lingula anatina]|eukprot:XP_013411663.1 uncharacterized protein LOC106174587 isoform X2 [Lingula anatina]